jgi:hypothetical protein
MFKNKCFATFIINYHNIQGRLSFLTKKKLIDKTKDILENIVLVDSIPVINN